MKAWMTELFHHARESGKVPDDWGKSIIWLIHTKGELHNFKNYRGIFLLSHACKTYERILESSLGGLLYQLNTNQFSFQPGRGTMNAIFTLRMIIEKLWVWN